jgi:hypothetical protein
VLKADGIGKSVKIGQTLSKNHNNRLKIETIFELGVYESGK